MELAISKCLNSPEYLSGLGTAVSKAIEKGMQDGFAAGITHGREGRVLTDVDAHNPVAEADYVSALQQLHTRLGLNESQPYADQLMVPIHHSPDKTVVCASALLLDLDVLDARMEGTFDDAPATVDLTTDLSVTLASTGTVTPLSVDDYWVMGTNDQSAMNESVVDEDINLFLNVDNAELDIPQ
nr:hypothetical protein [Tanacetum cinerariifolium]